MNSEASHRLKSVPPIVHIVITQATRVRAAGGITEEVFAAQIRRLAREELEPKGLTLLVRDLADGRRRFLVKETATGAVCEMLDFAADGTLEREESEVHAHAAH